MMNDAIGDDVLELRREVETLRHTVLELRTELGALTATSAGATGEDASEEAEVSSRRAMFKLVGGVAAGALAGGLVARTEPAAADSGAALVIGQLQRAQNITYLANGPAAANSAGTSLATEQTLFWADNRGSVLNHGIGIRGDGNGVNGVGLWGHSDSGGIGLLGDGGIGAQLAGSRAAIYLSGTTGAPPLSRVDAHKVGEIDIDSNADVWVCVVAGTPGTWRKLTGPAAAGSFHALNPLRMFDSRWAGGAKIVSGGTRLVSVADGHRPRHRRGQPTQRRPGRCHRHRVQPDRDRNGQRRVPHHRSRYRVHSDRVVDQLVRHR